MSNERQPSLSAEDELAAVERLKAGDSDALAILWHAHADTVYRTVIFPKLPVRDQAEEVLQNTFLKAYERIGGFSMGERGMLPWLKTIARNLATDVHRKHQRTDKFCQGYGQYLDAADFRSESHKRPDQALVEAEWTATVKTRVATVMDSGKLNDRYRSAITLRLFEDRTREACAEALGVKVGTFDVVFHRACKRFEAVYRDLYGSEDG